MVQMMEVRRKFFAGTISVVSLACHSSFIRLLRWSREELAAILNDSSDGIERNNERKELIEMIDEESRKEVGLRLKAEQSSSDDKKRGTRTKLAR